MQPGRSCYLLERKACLRCGSCSTLAPALFRVESDGARLLHQPATADEQRLAAAAALNCPTGAIREAPAS